MRKRNEERRPGRRPTLLLYHMGKFAPLKDICRYVRSRLCHTAVHYFREDDVNTPRSDGLKGTCRVSRHIFRENASSPFVCGVPSRVWKCQDEIGIVSEVDIDVLRLRQSRQVEVCSLQFFVFFGATFGTSRKCEREDNKRYCESLNHTIFSRSITNACAHHNTPLFCLKSYPHDEHFRSGQPNLMRIGNFVTRSRMDFPQRGHRIFRMYAPQAYIAASDVAIQYGDCSWTATAPIVIKTNSAAATETKKCLKMLTQKLKSLITSLNVITMVLDIET